MNDLIKKIDAARAGMRDKYEVLTECRAEILRLTTENEAMADSCSSASDKIEYLQGEGRWEIERATVKRMENHMDSAA